jgi:hypothetical protein
MQSEKVSIKVDSSRKLYILNILFTCQMYKCPPLIHIPAAPPKYAQSSFCMNCSQNASCTINIQNIMALEKQSVCISFFDFYNFNYIIFPNIPLFFKEKNSPSIFIIYSSNIYYNNIATL